MNKLENLLEQLVQGQHRLEARLTILLDLYTSSQPNLKVPDPASDWLSIRQAATLAGLSEKSLRRAIHKGQLQASNVGRRSLRPTWRIKKSALTDFLKAGEAGNNKLPASLPRSSGKYHSRHFPDL